MKTTTLQAKKFAGIITQEFGSQLEFLTGGDHDISASIMKFRESLDRVSTMLV